MEFSNEQLRDTIKSNAYPEEVVEVLKLLFVYSGYNVDDNMIKIIGSYVQKIQPFASDIDSSAKFIMLNEPINDMIDIFIKKLQDNINKIKVSDIVHFSDFKAGYDLRYYPSNYFIEIYDENTLFKSKKLEIPKEKTFEQTQILGELREGKVYDYNYKKMRNLIDDLNKNRLLEKEDYEILNKNALKSINAGNMEIIYNTLKKYFTLKWTIDELIAGQKILFDGTIMTLKDALLQQNSKGNVIKFDVVSFINNRWVEITCNYYIEQINSHGVVFPYNIPSPDVTDDIRELKKEITFINFMPNRYNPLKLAKRLWSYAKMNNDKQLLHVIYPLLVSNTALVGQINAEIEMILLILEHIKFNDIMFKQIKYQINYWKYRLDHNVELKLNYEILFELIDLIYKSNNVNNVIEMLNKIYDMNKPLVDDSALYYLKKHKIYPLSKKILNI